MIKVYKAQTKKFGKRYKFGVQVPNTVKEAEELDTVNCNILWKEAIEKETGQLFEYNTFNILEEGGKAPEGYKRIPYLGVFDVNIDLRRKYSICAGGHTFPEKQNLKGPPTVLQGKQYQIYVEIEQTNQKNNEEETE